MMDNFSHADLGRELSAAMPLLTSYFESSAVIHLVKLSSNGLILVVNNRMAQSLKVGSQEIIGKSFAGFLTSPDAESLARCLADKEALPDEELLLNLVDSEQMPQTLLCRLLPAENGLLLLGEPSLGDNQALQEELMQLNNQLAVLSRENIRKGR